MKGNRLYLRLAALKVLIVVSVALPLAACQPGPVPTATKPVPSKTATVVPTATQAGPAGVVELRLWTFLDPEGTDPRGQALKKVVENFNALHPNIKVTVENIHWGKIDAQVIQATAAGAGPDIVNIYTAQLPQHVAAGTVMPLNDYVDLWLRDEGKGYTFPLDAVTFDGKVMALPWETRVWLLWYRKDLLEQAGLQPPKTLDELAEVGGRLRKHFNGQIMGFAFSFSEADLAADFIEKFQPMLWAAGGRLLDDQGKAAFAGPEGIRVMQWMYDVVRKHEAMGREVLSLTGDDMLSGIQAGTIAMIMEGSMRVASGRAAAGVGDNLVTTRLPGWTADEPSPTLVAGQTLAIGATTKHPDEAWEFIKYYLSKDSQLAFAAAGVMPVMMSALEDPQIASSPQGAELMEWTEYARELGRMERYPEDFAQLSEILVRAAQQIVFQDAPIKETLERAAAEYNALHQ